MFKASVTGIGIIHAHYLNDMEIKRIGQIKHCAKCDKEFIVGEMEVEKARFDYKGNLKREFELFKDCEACGKSGKACEKCKPVFDVKVSHFDKLHLSLTEKAIVYGVEKVFLHYCPGCSGEILASDTAGIAEYSRGKADRSFSE